MEISPYSRNKMSLENFSDLKAVHMVWDANLRLLWGHQIRSKRIDLLFS